LCYTEPVAKIHKKIKKHATGFRKELTEQLLKLATSGLGLVAALAWNELIKELVNNFIKPFTGKFSGLISLFIYAVIVTILAVTVTYNLTKLIKKK